ncbi:MAG: aminomethyl-transferring glycine dehydrogenase subunit GcvPA [Pirellulales bacterium]|nr:aminomethyl-transferring glycine dehydrogenase subunit GcvPA [Pirellulales bacterium]
MPYFANTPEDERDMLAAIGVASIEELFELVPADLRLRGALQLPPALTEVELTQHMSELAARNESAADKVCFLGAGSYDHFIPAIVDSLAGRGEFYTSYTPYQPEASQGNLQAFFEYQTLITQLTGMDVSNASLYDGGSAATEAMLMAISVTKRHGNVVVPASVHPEYRQILATYLKDLGIQLVTAPVAEGVLRPADLQACLSDQTAGVLIQQPNFFGNLESMRELADITHRAGALFCVSVDPISLGLLERPADYGADIVTAEGQSLGSPLSFGGPYLGIMACREEFVRRMPGRLCGQTVDRNGRRCFVLTLQTREQHIRREKATSNICTNQGLFALRATIYLASLGPQGLREVAELSLRKAHYLRDLLAGDTALAPAFDQPFFKEFVMRVPDGAVDRWLDEAQEAGFFAGVPLARWYPELADCVLITVTEKRTRAEMDRLAQVVRRLSRKEAIAHA